VKPEGISGMKRGECLKDRINELARNNMHKTSETSIEEYFNLRWATKLKVLVI
jgi:hypothetical protein